MLRTKRHDRENLVDELERHVLVKQIRHAVHENLRRFPPVQRLSQPVLVALDIGKVAGRPESIRHGLCVAVFAASADLCTAGNRVPCLVGPLNAAAAHLLPESTQHRERFLLFIESKIRAWLLVQVQIERLKN